VHIRAQTDPWHAADGDSIQLVPRGLRVARAVTAAKGNVGPDIADHLYTRTAAEALKEVLIQQAGPDQLRVERRMSQSRCGPNQIPREEQAARTVRKLRLTPGPGAATSAFPLGLSACREW
jgi:hypothetical protein